MSSSPPTETSRWRSPSTWSLRARLVAATMALLAVALIVVGVTTEITLRKALYDRIDGQLTAAASRSQGRFGDREAPPAGTPAPECEPDRPVGFPPGQVIGTLVVRTCAGIVEARILGEVGQEPPAIPADFRTTLNGISPGADPVTVDLGGELDDYRVVAQRMPDNSVLITGVPLRETQETLYLVAGVVGGALVIALIAVAAAGTTIIRRNLEPLQRVAATATRVSELRLDRGEVDLAQRVPAADTDPRTEVGRVGAALNRLLDHVGNALEARHASEQQVRQFVADASHELRTPLAAIRGYAELSRRSRQPVPEEVGHVLRRVESEAVRMTALVEDLLLLARLDAGRPLAHDPVDLTMLVVDAVSDAHAAGPGHDWQLDLPDEPVVAAGDPARLHQVLANLLANARTHTPEGTTVTVGVSATTTDALLRVTDAGPGIPAELRPHVFERFARGDSSRSRAAGSTGLGLSIVHAVVTAHGGDVTCESEPGRTEFVVRLPLSPAEPEPVHEHVAELVE